MDLQKSNHTIPTLKINDKFAEKGIDKANMLNDYFCSQAVVNYNNKPLPQHTFTCNSRLNSITISQLDVRDVLNNLNAAKIVSEYDQKIPQSQTADNRIRLVVLILLVHVC